MSDRDHVEDRKEDTVGRPYRRADEPFTYDGWRASGPYTGYGPADYQQPEDERIMEEVNERLMQHGRLNARGISVVVEDGKVSLQGVVSSERDRRVAEDVAELVPGVRRVYDRLRIAGDLHSQPPTE